MKRVLVLSALLLPAWMYALGSGVSLFIPRQAPLAFSEYVTYSLKLDKAERWLLPLTLSHRQIRGLSVAGLDYATSPWIYSSSIQLSALLEYYIPVRIFFISMSAGPTLTWHYLAEGIYSSIQSDINRHNNYDSVSLSSLDTQIGLGLGFLAGAAFNLRFNKITWKLGVSYEWNSAALDLQADYIYTSGGSSAAGQLLLQDYHMILQGLRIDLSLDIPLL